MEAQAPAAELTPEMIGHAFVSQFYTILHQTPELVHKFYENTSTMSRPAQDGSLTTVTTMKDINGLMLSLDCKDYKAEIMTVDAQASYKDGVIVLVTGCLTGEENVKRKFTESFFLAPQSNGYYVLNDAFRFIDEETMPAVNPVEDEESHIDATSSTVAKEQDPADATEKSLPNLTAAAEPVFNGIANVFDKSDEQLTVQEPVVVEPPTESVNHIDNQVVVESSFDIQDAPKKSYASILKDRKESMRTTSMKTKSTNNGHQSHESTTSVPRPQENGTAPPAEQPVKEAAISTVVPESSAPNGHSKQGNDKGYSIYIGDLPYNATVDHVEQEFKKFGPIKHGGIQVRCSKGFCFGFVEFESLSSVQKAIEASPIHIGGHEAFVEEKKTSTRVVNGVSTFPSGRSGYRGDGFRGRGNFSGGRGYGRNDYGRRGDYGNGARNGDGYHRGYQNGGGRTIRQGGPK